MLPIEHLRVFRRKGVIKPILLRETLGIVDTVIAVYSDHVGQKRGVLNEVLDDCEHLGYDFKLVRGLAAVLESRAVINPRSVISPLEARRLVFAEASKQVVAYEDERLGVLKLIAEKLDVSVDELDDSLYADLQDEQYLVTFNAPSPDELVMYYNFANTVALLAYSTRIEISYDGHDDYLESLIKSLAEPTINQGNKTRFMVDLKPTRRITQRGSKIDEILRRLLKNTRWSIQATVRYPTRYKTLCIFQIDAEGDGKLLEPDPLRDETIIEIGLQESKKKPLRYGDVVVLDEVSMKQGITVSQLMTEINEEGSGYRDLSGVLVSEEKYIEISEALEKMEILGEAQSFMKSIGVRNFLPVLESFGYYIDWRKPRKESRVYRL